MPGVLALTLLAVPLIELWLILEVADRIGVLETVASLIGVALVGTWLLMREGRATYRKMRAATAAGQLPASELIDAAIIVVGGALLLTPGFFTDIVGLILLFPPTRTPLKGTFSKLFRWWFAKRFGTAGVVGKTVYDTRATRVRRTEATARPESPAPTLPSSGRRDAEDDSPDRG